MLSAFAPLLALVAAIWRFKKLNPAMRVLALTPLLGIVFEIILAILRPHRINNLPLLHLYTVLQFIAIAWFYLIALKGFVPRRLMLPVILGFLVFTTINSLFIQPLDSYNSYALGLQCLVIIAFSLAGFYRIMAEMKEDKPSQSPWFWFHTAFLIYFSASLFILVLSIPMMELGKDFNYLVWGFRGLFIIFFYLSLAVGFLLKK